MSITASLFTSLYLYASFFPSTTNDQKDNMRPRESQVIRPNREMISELVVNWFVM